MSTGLLRIVGRCFIMTYEEQLKTPEWYYVRDRVLERDRYRCVRCRSEKNLQVHHLEYIQGKKAWEYNDSYLITLCGRCHVVQHGKGEPLDSLDIALSRLVHVAHGVRKWCQTRLPKENGETTE